MPSNRFLPLSSAAALTAALAAGCGDSTKNEQAPQAGGAGSAHAATNGEDDSLAGEPVAAPPEALGETGGASGAAAQHSPPSPETGVVVPESTDVVAPAADSSSTTSNGAQGAPPDFDESDVPNSVENDAASTSGSPSTAAPNPGVPDATPTRDESADGTPVDASPDESEPETHTDTDTDNNGDTGAELLTDGASGPPLAFPGAEGFGRNASGGRGGQVVHVTNLNDSGDGSFRDAVSQPNRIVVFDVGGIIPISSRIVVHSNITVAGQTAPGGGITIYGNGIALNGDSGGGNVILRYFRVRMGKNGDSGKDAVSISLGEDYMFDHMSISWGRDGTLDVNGTPIDNLSFQESIIAQGINNDNHSTGGLMQPSGVDGHWSMIRSLYIDNKTRNPKARGRHEFINSVLYNWAEHGYIMGDTTNGESHANVIGNYFVYGPSSNSNSHITGTTEYFHLYAEDNWVDANTNGLLDGSLLTDFKTATVEGTAYAYPGVTRLLSAEQALNHVADNAGASLTRDAVDEMLIEQLRSFGTLGQIINTEDDNGISGNVGTLEAGVAPLDTDRDGMPDEWESQRGLDPNTADDSADDDGDGYTNIEEYLSSIVDDGI